MIEVGVSHLVWVRRGDGPVAMDPPDNGVVSFILAKKGGVCDVGGGVIFLYKYSHCNKN